MEPAKLSVPSFIAVLQLMTSVTIIIIIIESLIIMFETESIIIFNLIIIMLEPESIIIFILIINLPNLDITIIIINVPIIIINCPSLNSQVNQSTK